MATISTEISTIAKNIKKIRKKKSISQDKLSKLAEIAYNTIIKIESRTIQNSTIETVRKIAKALDVFLNKLVKS